MNVTRKQCQSNNDKVWDTLCEIPLENGMTRGVTRSVIFTMPVPPLAFVPSLEASEALPIWIACLTCLGGSDSPMAVPPMG